MELQGFAGSCDFDVHGGRCRVDDAHKNLETFASADVVASLLNGDARFAISHMYFRYRNTSQPITQWPAITRSTGRAEYAALTGAGPAYEDYLRVPIVSQGRQFAYPAGTADYRANAVHFVANSALSSLVGESPARNYFAASGSHGPSTIFQIALVAAPVPLDPNQDRVFSVLNLQTPHVFVPGSYPGEFWTLRLS